MHKFDRRLERLAMVMPLTDHFDPGVTHFAHEHLQVCALHADNCFSYGYLWLPCLITYCIWLLFMATSYGCHVINSAMVGILGDSSHEYSTWYESNAGEAYFECCCSSRLTYNLITAYICVACLFARRQGRQGRGDVNAIFSTTVTLSRLPS